MLVLPTVIITLSSIGGAGGIALTVKSVMDSLSASATNRFVQERNEQNLLFFESCSKKTETSINNLGKQRMIISNDFNVFVNSFEKIHNRPEFSSKESMEFPSFDFDEVKNVSVVARGLVGATSGAIVGATLGAAASSGTTAAMIALGKASTGAKIAELTGAAKIKAALAALGGGAKAFGGGGIALGTVVLNAASLGVGVLFEGIAMAYAGSLAKKEADKALSVLEDNEKIINEAIQTQISVAISADKIRRASVKICNGKYKSIVFQLKKLVDQKSDWNTYSSEEKTLVENCILLVQTLHYLNNIALYNVISVNDEGEIEEIEPNTEEINTALIRSGRVVMEVN